MINTCAQLELRWRNPESGVLQVGESLSYAQAQTLLSSFGPLAALVEMFVDDDEIVLFVLRAAGTQPFVVRVPLPSSALEQSLRTYYREVVEYNLHGDVGQSWQDVIRPILISVMPYLEAASPLYLVPHGPLRYLPFHCVEIDGGCLIDRFALAYAPSIGLLDKVVKRSRGRQRREPPLALVVGNPTLDLQSAEAEAVRVAERFDTEPLIGRHATKVAVRSRLPNKDLVHLACHSYHNSYAPLESGLLFAGRRVLTAGEIMVLGAQPDLVVLSACESGLQTEEQGLPMVFLEAGASAVLGTLWLVDDEVTGDFVVEFYRNLFNSVGQRIQGTATALQRTMLKVRKEQEHPYYWAPFELMGAWD